MFPRVFRPSVLRHPLPAQAAGASQFASSLVASFTTASLRQAPAAAAAAAAQSAAPADLPPASPPPAAARPQPQIPHETLTLLPALRAQPSHYITIHIHKFPFLVTAGDTITLPFRIPDVRIGDTLRLTHASVLGSRDYTLKGTPWIDERLFECRATVVEETAEPMRIKEKTKRRQRRIKKVKSKHRYTVLRVKELVIKDAPEELAAS